MHTHLFCPKVENAKKNQYGIIFMVTQHPNYKILKYRI